MSGDRIRGGCSSCDMHGPKRDTVEQANKDIVAHDKRMHGGKSVGGYLEAAGK
jgi:hypothetical protein